MQDVTLAAGGPPRVDRAETSGSIRLTFEGTRAEHVRDRGLRIRISLPLPRAQELRRQLVQLLPPVKRLDWQPAVLEVLAEHRGETGADEDALEVVQRLSRAWHESHDDNRGR
jgi:hypothetical protein